MLFTGWRAPSLHRSSYLIHRNIAESSNEETEIFGLDGRNRENATVQFACPAHTPTEWLQSEVTTGKTVKSDHDSTRPVLWRDY